MLVCVLFLFMLIVEPVGLSGLEHCFVKAPSAETVVSECQVCSKKFMPHSPPLYEATKCLQIGN